MGGAGERGEAEFPIARDEDGVVAGAGEEGVGAAAVLAFTAARRDVDSGGDG